MRKKLERLAFPEIDEANQETVQRMIDAQPFLVDFLPAGEVVPEMTKTTIQYAGPPISWERRCGSQKGAIIGATLFEGLADNPHDAEQMVLGGEIQLVPNHHRSTVGSMAGAISFHIPVWVVRNKRHGNMAYCTLETNLSFGGHDATTLRTLEWQRDVMQPALSRALSNSDGIDLNAITAKALQMGEDCHSRFEASTDMINIAITKLLLDARIDQATILELLEYMDSDRAFYLGFVMAASKVTADAARGVRNSTVCVVLSRNGTECGIQVSGMDDEWFTGPANVIDEEGMYFPGYSVRDADRDIGDSAITEAVGLGGCAIYASPTHWHFFGANPGPKARDAQEKMWAISTMKHPQFVIPALDFQGAGLGIDIRKVVAENYEPIMTTVIAPKDPSIGRMIGAGFGRAPIEAFEKACVAMERSLNT